MNNENRKSLLEIFATHPVAMNILMAIILILGYTVLLRINVQFFPTFSIDFVTVTTTWPGASAEDVEQSITNRLELELKNVDNLKDITSTSRLGSSVIVLEFVSGTNIDDAADEVENIVNLTKELPEDSEEPVVSEVKRYETIANLIVTGTTLDQLRILGNEFRDELLGRGIGKINIAGLPDQEIAIQVSSRQLRALRMSLNQIGQRIRSNSVDSPIGTAGREDAARQLRFTDQRRGEIGFEDLPIIADTDGRLLTLQDIATIQRRPVPDQLYLSYNGRPAIELQLQRLESSDTLQGAAIIYAWLEEVQPNLPEGVELRLYDDQSVSLQQRIDILMKNGVMGLVLVLIILFLFLNMRLAFWVAAGIPVSLLGAAGVLYLVGGTINMITLFGFIMTIGIIVDDAIVVGEEALTQFNASNSPNQAVSSASKRMFVPIVAASFTTIFAFTPVVIVPGVIGTILSNIALVVVCVVAASLIESFLILPGHLRHSFVNLKKNQRSKGPSLFDRGFTFFRDRMYRPLLRAAIQSPITTISVGVAILIFTIGLFASGRLAYTFFPTPELNLVYANVSFVSGSPRFDVDQYLEKVEEALYETEADLGGHLIAASIVRHGALTGDDGVGTQAANLGSVVVELTASDSRTVRTTEFVRKWRSKLHYVPGLESIVVITPGAGPPGRDIEIRISGSNYTDAKSAALALAEHLSKIQGVFGISDDTSYGRQQQILTLTSLGQSLGLTVNEVSRQLRSAIEGELLQSYTTEFNDVEVNLMLPDEERDQISTLENLHITLPSGESVPLLDVVHVETTRGFDTLRHASGKIAIEVNASVDASVASLAEINRGLETSFLPELEDAYGIDWSYGLRQADQSTTEDSMRTGAIIALVLIYLTLAWIFGSYSWPFFVMLAIPFGIVGAAWAHYLMGLTVSIITILGLIGLSGIVVNNAIVLVVFYKQYREAGQRPEIAMLEAGCRRLRPVVLSSLTTICGLLPLLFETSTQAQFLIPMAATLAFGLTFSTVLVLLFIPAVLTLFDRIRLKFSEASSTPATTDAQLADKSH